MPGLRRDGCHHCGKRKGNIVADHIPPNKLIQPTGVLALEQPLQRAMAGLPAPWRDFACALSLTSTQRLPYPAPGSWAGSGSPTAAAQA